MFKKLAASAVIFGLASFAQSALALEFSDTSIGYRFGTNFSEPGVRKANGESPSITKNILFFNHVNRYKYGGNYFNIDILRSSKDDPANGGDSGATEAYAIYRHSLSLNKVTGTKTFAFGPFRDITLDAGVDLNTKNTAFAPRKVMPVVGPSFAINVPGFWNVGILYNKEFNHNGITRRDVTFNSAVMLTTAWGIPLGNIGVPVAFEGFGSINSPKGKDGFGNDTKTEIQFRPKVMFDVGALLGAPNTFKAGLGWQYWYNKFGNDHERTVGAIENSLFFEARLHF